MEDEFCTAHDFCAVFDGHGGSKVSRYLRQNLYAEVQSALPAVQKSGTDTTGNTTASPKAPPAATVPTVDDYESALRLALERVDGDVQQINHWSYQGSTVVAAWIHEAKLRTPDDDDDSADCRETTTTETIQRTLLLANVGDSRAILSRNASAIDLTRDHRPDDPIERERIEAAGGSVSWHGHVDRKGRPIPGTGVYRVNGNLALARAIGDRSERPVVTGEPDISILPLQEDVDDFVLLATDGLWDVMTSSEVVAFVHALLDGEERDSIVDMLVEEALRRGSYDNISVVIVWLRRATS